MKTVRYTVGVVGHLLVRGCLSIEVNGRTVGTFRIVHYIMGVRFSGVSVKWGSTVDIAKMIYLMCLSFYHSEFLWLQ